MFPEEVPLEDVISRVTSRPGVPLKLLRWVILCVKSGVLKSKRDGNILGNTAVQGSSPDQKVSFWDHHVVGGRCFWRRDLLPLRMCRASAPIPCARGRLNGMTD